MSVRSIHSAFVHIFALGLVVVSMPVNADNSGNQLKFDLQAAMQNYIEDRLVDGEYLYLDADNGVVARARPSAAHPTILQIKNGYILCSDFRTSAGEALNVDFFLARVGEEYVVFSHSVQERMKIKKLMKAGLAKKM